MVVVADSIGIKLLRPNCLLAGVGNELHEYFLDGRNDTIHKRIPLRFRSKIYGISSPKRRSYGKNEFIVIHGGKEIAVATVNRENDLQIVKRLILNDWISSVQPYESLDAGKLSFAALTAHNVVMEIHVNLQGKCQIINKSSCVDKCTLYCSLITGENWSHSTILAGNAFGELIIWNIVDRQATCEILQRIAAHNGVIFSIDCSIENNIITTTSDDRSVKIWKIDFKNDPAKWPKSGIESTKTLFGHTSRIFNHKLISYHEKLYVVTLGEDSIICIWDIDGELIFKKFIATKAPLWNLDYDSERQYLFACGSDGNIHQVNLGCIIDGKSFAKRSLSMNGFKQGEYAIKLAILQNDAILVVITNKQNVYCKQINGNDEWSTISMENIKSKFTLLETNGDCIALAGFQWTNVLQYNNGHFSSILQREFCSGMIRSFKFLTKSEFVACDNKGQCSYIELTNTNVEIIEFELPICKERWITVAAKIDNYLVLGDRCGHIHLYEFSWHQRKIDLRFTLKNVHGNLGCTSIDLDPLNRFHFTTSGHDGRLRLIVINDSKQLAIQFTYDVPIRWCDKTLALDSLHSNMLLAGFNDSHFIAWKKDNSFRFEFYCGGGHRYWDLHLNANQLIANMVYIRNRNLFSVQFQLNDTKLHPFQIARNDWHSRPCNTMCIIKSFNDRYLMLSGGDDNLLKINEINIGIKGDGEVRLYHQSDMVLHISNVKTVFAISIDNHRKWLVFSSGGRAQLCVTEVEVTSNDPPKCREICNFMLLSSDLERKRSAKSQSVNIDPETRFMSAVAVFQKEDNSFSIFVGCSDGFIRKFHYINGNISLKTSVTYGRCILHVHHFTFMDCDYLVSMATDGLIVFWLIDDFNDKPSPFLTLQHHDSGINSFDAFIDDTNKMFIATGGDDQVIALTVLILKENTNNPSMNIKVEKSHKYRYNHTAQVNGVNFCTFNRILFTVSVDQNIMCISLDDFSIKKVGYTCISDAKGLKWINEINCLFIYGCGVQSMKPFN